MRDRFPVITDLRIAHNALARSSSSSSFVHRDSAALPRRESRGVFSLLGPDIALPVPVKKINDLAVPPETPLNNGRRVIQRSLANS